MMAIVFLYTVIKDRPRKLHQRNPEFCPVKPDPTAPHFLRLRTVVIACRVNRGLAVRYGNTSS